MVMIDVITIRQENINQNNDFILSNLTSIRPVPNIKVATYQFLDNKYFKDNTQSVENSITGISQINCAKIIIDITLVLNVKSHFLLTNGR